MVSMVDQGEQSPHGEDGSDTPNSPDEAEPEKAQVDPMETLTKHIAFRLSNEFSPITDPVADTAIYLGIPARIPGQDDSDHSHVCNHFNRIHLMQSSILKSLGSSKIEALFRPNACIRAEKKFKKLGAYSKLNLTMRAQIKYHLNLEPSQDGDEAALLIMSLSCTRGILNWHLASQVYNLSPSSVAGVDDFDTPNNPYFMNLIRAREGPATIELPVTDEYCPVRHHSALERVLNAIQGNDPKIDSAPKMWTYFAVAQHLSCAHHSKVNHWILDWFNSNQNSHFVQNNPEIAYRIGVECQWGEFARDAFAILVGEKALADAVGQLWGQVASSTRSVHGRPLEILDDDERNRIGHAASSLIARTQHIVHKLGVVVDWLPKSHEYTKLLEFRTQTEMQENVIRNAKSAIRNYIQRRILEYLIMRLDEVHEELHACLPGAVLPHAKHPISFLETYNNLPQRARIFTRSFWLGISQIDFGRPRKDSSFSLSSLSERDRIDVESDPILGQIDFGLYNNVEGNAQKVQQANDLIYASHAAPHAFLHNDPFQAPPDRPISAFLGKRSATIASMTGASNSELEDMRDTDLEPLIKHQHDNIVDVSPTAGKRRKTLEDSSDLIPLPIRSRPADENTVPSSSADHLSPETSPDQGEFSSSLWKKKSFFRVKAGSVSEKERALKRQGYSIKQIAEKINCASDPWAEVDDFWEDTPAAKSTSSKPFVPSEPGTGLTGPRSINGTPGNFPPADRAPLRVTNPVSAEASPLTRRVMQQFSDIPAPPSFGLYSRNPPSICADDPKASNKALLHHRAVDLHTMYGEFNRLVHNVAQEVVYPPHLFHGREPVPVNLIDFVIALSDEEWKFLPLWAGGCDDGSGGVFESAIPNLEGGGGFRGGKRGMGRGGVGNGNGNGNEGAESVSSTDSAFENIGPADALSSTARASYQATDGMETTESFGSHSEMASEDLFLNQDDVYEVIREMKAQQAATDASTGDGQTGIVARNGGSDVDDDDFTIMGARSVDGDDVQAEFFGGDDEDDDDDDDEDNDDDDPSFPNGHHHENISLDDRDDDHDHDFLDVKGKAKAQIDHAPIVESMDSSDSEMEFIDKDNL